MSGGPRPARPPSPVPARRRPREYPVSRNLRARPRPVRRGDVRSRRDGRWEAGGGAQEPPCFRESQERGDIDVRCEGESVVFMSLSLTGWLAFRFPTV